MNTVRKHWLSVAVTIAVVALGIITWRANFAGAALLVQQPEYAELDQSDHHAIRRLMDQIALDREALIALNPTAMQAESVYSTVRDWYDDNQISLSSLKSNVDDAVVAERVAKKAIALGPANPTNDEALASAREDLATARAAYDSALSSLKSDINSLLSGSQQTTWSIIAKGHGQHMPIRMLDLSDEQRVTISKEQRRFRSLRAAADTEQARSQAQSDHNAAMDSILTTDQRNEIAGYKSNYATASANVADAFETVLPVDEG